MVSHNLISVAVRRRIVEIIGRSAVRWVWSTLTEALRRFVPSLLLHPPFPVAPTLSLPLLVSNPLSQRFFSICCSLRCVLPLLLSHCYLLLWIETTHFLLFFNSPNQLVNRFTEGICKLRSSYLSSSLGYCGFVANLELN